MKICVLDPFSGISGDMTVGALLDAGASEADLFAGLDSLAIGARYRAEKTRRNGIAGTKFHVEYEETRQHRHLPHILKMIDGSALPAPVKQDAASVFQTLGKAEAAVHGVPIEKVHFHEVGAADSISDIVGACLGFHLLGVERIHCTAINTGSGTVNTDHGVLPVPAPATAKLLEGKPVYARGPETELTTPTGAAIVAALATGTGPMPSLVMEATGFGAGSKDFPEHANVLRILLGQSSGAAEAMTISVIEASIDDSSPQVLGYAADRLLEAGALDVTLQPVFMKKQRPGTVVAVLARPEDQERLAQILMAETSTLGVRIHSAERRVESRRHVEVQTPHGKVRIKVAGSGAWAPEYEDCQRLARATGLPLKEILAEAGFAYQKSIR
jgi:pyridinium-3,5-bisthiocarboxylic acid mononucleotide nickel chelatase